MTVRVVLADDIAEIRDVLAHILRRSPDIDLVAIAEDEATLLAAIAATRPDVVVADVRMPPTNTDEGVRVASRLAVTQPDIGFVILSQYSDPESLARFFEQGNRNRGWVLKERVHADGQLIRAVKTVHEGDPWIDARATAPTSRVGGVCGL